MKQIYTILIAVLLTACVFLPQQSSAQSPGKMSYQAVIRNSSDQLVTSQNIGMQISILQGTASGEAVYVETQTPTTNANGLVTIEIGGDDATIVNGDFSAIDWANSTYFIKTETDPTGGINYTITGTSQLLSVPYALHAKTAETVTGEITVTEADPLYSASQAANIIAADIANLGNLSGTNTGDQDLNGLATQSALEDTASAIRTDIPDVSGFISNETDPVYSASQAANIIAADIANLGNLSGTNTGDQDINGITTNTHAIKDTASQIRADIPDVSGFISTETDPVFTSSQANNITATDITNLSNLSGTNTGDQNLTQVLTQSNLANMQIKNVSDPSDAQDVATKAYVDRLENILINTGLAVKDIDGNIYSTVEIGTQIWMLENLKVTHYPNGDVIPLVTDNTSWKNLADNNTDDAYSYYNNNASGEANAYGVLYTYAAAIGDNWTKDNTANQGVCPDGWHLPTDAEWTILTDYLGDKAGDKMREIGTTHWNSPNTGADNSSGFTALPGGYRNSGNGGCDFLGSNGYFWSATEDNAVKAWLLLLNCSSSEVFRYDRNKSNGVSVRCLRD